MTEIFKTFDRPEAYARAADFAKANRSLLVYVIQQPSEREDIYSVRSREEDDTAGQLARTEGVLFVFRGGIEDA